MGNTAVLNLMRFLDAGVSPFHATANTVALLKKAGFQEIDPAKSWQIEPGQGYVAHFDSAVIAFRAFDPAQGFRIIGSHTDSPSMSLKPNALLRENGYLRLNTEVYGGPILSTWMDRPLSIAGRVTLQGESPLCPVQKLIDFKKPVAIIPNLAIHMNREVNKGVELNKQTDMLPFVGIDRKEQGADFWMQKIAGELGIDAKEILSTELYLYDPAPACLIGFEEELLSAPRIDNLAMLHASVEALLDSPQGIGVQVAVGFDSEEIGSATRQGADSAMLYDVLRRISLAFNQKEEDFLASLQRSFLISADMAHAVHPAHPEKHDPTHRPALNQGPVIKISANKKYTTDAQSSAVFKSLCQEAQVPFQEFVNRSDAAGGSTIGPISSTHLAIPSVDVGNPMLGMHSIRELAGAKDQESMIQVFRAFYAY